MTDTKAASPSDSHAATQQSACVLCFNSADPTGSGGLAADQLTAASMGAHAVPVTAGVLVRDTREVVEFHALDAQLVDGQARQVLEDIAVQLFKVGFVGSVDNIATIAEIASDYSDVPLLLYVPDMGWWSDSQIDQYLDACQELLLSQTSVLVGSYNTLLRWLLPDWDMSKPASPREIARAADSLGVPYTVITGWSSDAQHLDIVACTPNATLVSCSIERIDSSYIGSGDTFSAALAALLASGSVLNEAVEEAGSYLEQALGSGYRLGMGHLLPDHLFWAQPEDEGDEDEQVNDIDLPPNATRH